MKSVIILTIAQGYEDKFPELVVCENMEATCTTANQYWGQDGVLDLQVMNYEKFMNQK